jgi:hypothetical protein
MYLAGGLGRRCIKKIYVNAFFISKLGQNGRMAKKAKRRKAKLFAQIYLRVLVPWW